MKGREFLHKKYICFSYILFIFNNRNNKIPLKLSIKGAFIHKIRLVVKRNIKLNTHYAP